jgi:hypothetical protein
MIAVVPWVYCWCAANRALFFGKWGCTGFDGVVEADVASRSWHNCVINWAELIAGNTNYRLAAA